MQADSCAASTALLEEKPVVMEHARGQGFGRGLRGRGARGVAARGGGRERGRGRQGPRGRNGGRSKSRSVGDGDADDGKGDGDDGVGDDGKGGDDGDGDDGDGDDGDGDDGDGDGDGDDDEDVDDDEYDRLVNKLRRERRDLTPEEKKQFKAGIKSQKANLQRNMMDKNLNAAVAVRALRETVTDYALIRHLASGILNIYAMMIAERPVPLRPRRWSPGNFTPIFGDSMQSKLGVIKNLKIFDEYIIRAALTIARGSSYSQDPYEQNLLTDPNAVSTKPPLLIAAAKKLFADPAVRAMQYERRKGGGNEWSELIDSNFLHNQGPEMATAYQNYLTVCTSIVCPPQVCCQYFYFSKYCILFLHNEENGVCATNKRSTAPSRRRRCTSSRSGGSRSRRGAWCRRTSGKRPRTCVRRRSTCTASTRCASLGSPRWRPRSRRCGWRAYHVPPRTPRSSSSPGSTRRRRWTRRWWKPTSRGYRGVSGR